jgi:hypothetical protein
VEWKGNFQDIGQYTAFLVMIKMKNVYLMDPQSSPVRLRANRDISTGVVYKKPVELLFDLYQQKNSGQGRKA